MNSKLFVVKFLRDLTAVTFFKDYEVYADVEYLAEHVDSQTLRVHDERFAGGSAQVTCRWGHDWMPVPVRRREA